MTAAARNLAGGNGAASYSRSRLSSGAFQAVTNTQTQVISPPKITEGVTPKSLAATPDSKAPTSFEELMKKPLTEETRHLK